MKVYKLHEKQQLPISIEAAWDFLSNPENLKVITPDNLGFKITSDLPEDGMYAGQLITYTVTPLFGIPMTWVTEITHVEHPKYFVDEQRFGPYSMWHHEHHIKEIPGGIEMTDIIHYVVPLGILGRLVHPFLVRPQLRKIFNYRRKVLTEKFGVL